MRNIFLSTKKLVTPYEQGADFVELFFDLVFVYAITRITAITAHHLDIPHILQSVFIFWMVWWGWTQITWTLNVVNTKIAGIRMTVLIATGVAFIMASSLSQAFSDGAIWFILPYVVIRMIGISLYIRVTIIASESFSRVIAYATPSVIAWIFLLIGAFADPSQRIIWWLIAVGFDMLAGYLGGRAEGSDIRPKHFSERHSLIVIIALGESLIVAANAVGASERSQSLIIVGGLAVVVTCLLWWSYFAWVNEHLEEHLSKSSGIKQAQLGRDTYSFMHFPILLGIIGIAVGFEIILIHPDDLLSINVALILGVGYVLFIGFTAATVWKTSSLILIPRLFLLTISTVGIILSVGQPSWMALSIITVSLTLMAVIEWKKCRHQ